MGQIVNDNILWDIVQGRADAIDNHTDYSIDGIDVESGVCVLSVHIPDGNVDMFKSKCLKQYYVTEVWHNDSNVYTVNFRVFA